LKTTVPVLHPLTTEAREAIKEEEISIDKFPFRIGRESRRGTGNVQEGEFDRRKHGSSPDNDYYLIDNGEQLTISREHLQVEKREDNTYEVLDRESMCGITVDDHIIGNNSRTKHYPVTNGSIIIIGTPKSPYMFKFISPAE
jgi:hypothetical protein